MKPNKRNISRIPARFILNPDISEESGLSSDSENEIYEAVNDNKTSDSGSQEEDDADNDNNVVSSSGDDLPSSSNGQQSNSKLKWDTADPEHVVIRDLPLSPSGPLIPQEPIDYFRGIFTDELLMRIVGESNKYALQVDVTKCVNPFSAEYFEKLALKRKQKTQL